MGSIFDPVSPRSNIRMLRPDCMPLVGCREVLIGFRLTSRTLSNSRSDLHLETPQPQAHIPWTSLSSRRSTRDPTPPDTAALCSGLRRSRRGLCGGGARSAGRARGVAVAATRWRGLAGLGRGRGAGRRALGRGDVGACRGDDARPVGHRAPGRAYRGGADPRTPTALRAAAGALVRALVARPAALVVAG